MTQMETNDEFRTNIQRQLAKAEKEIHQIELTTDKSKRKRRRELKKIIRHYKAILK